MNERIRELWKAAAVREDSNHPWTYDPDLHVEKFAELVVRECVKFLEENSGYDDSNNAWHPEPEDLLKHFGIEESKREKFDRAMKQAFKDGVDLSGKETP